MISFSKILSVALLILLFSIVDPAIAAPGKGSRDVIIVKTGLSGGYYSAEWKNALSSRMPKNRIDSLGNLAVTPGENEKAWELLIRSKVARWNQSRDSLQVPFDQIKLADTVYVLIGYLGSDDGFTFGSQTVCLDLNALQTEYGSAAKQENDSRIDRIFSHEYTHLLHKAWMRKHNVRLTTFKDSIWWECIYEGIGMYRSLNPKWLPVNGRLPGNTIDAMNRLTPVFVDRLVRIGTTKELTGEEKEDLHRNLSRGNVDQKWGAFPVAIWLALEAGGDDKQLVVWINRGSKAVEELAEKYLYGDLLQRFSNTFK